MNVEYKIIAEFKTHEIKMIIVKLPGGTHIMPVEEWKQVCKSLRYKQCDVNKKRNKIA